MYTYIYICIPIDDGISKINRLKNSVAHAEFVYGWWWGVTVCILCIKSVIDVIFHKMNH